MFMKFAFITSYIKNYFQIYYKLRTIRTNSKLFFHETGLPINSMYSTTVVSFFPWFLKKNNCKGKLKKEIK